MTSDTYPGQDAASGPPGLLALYRSALSFDAATRRSGLTEGALATLVAAGDLLTVGGPDGPRLPAWQFHPAAEHGYLEGIAAVAAAFAGPVQDLSSWMTQTCAQLGGRAPCQALLIGDLATVTAAATSV